MNLHAGSVVVNSVTRRSRFLYVHTYDVCHGRRDVCHVRRERGRNLGASGATRRENHFLKRVSAKLVPIIRVAREKVVRHQ